MFPLWFTNEDLVGLSQNQTCNGDDTPLRMQSGDEVSHPTTVGDVYETANFKDADEQSYVGAKITVPKYYPSPMSLGKLQNWFERPVLISTYTWAFGGVASATINPWSLYMLTSAIQEKLNYFAFFRGNLRIKIVINSTSFNYGELLLTYRPLTTGTVAIPYTIYSRTLLTQRPHLWIEPQNCTGGEMTLPFIWPADYCPLTAASVAEMGSIQIDEVIPLDSANAATSSVVVQIYAWMEDITLTTPTVSLAMQSGDEYGNSAISGPATALANAASYFTNIPIIAPFATATQIGASAVSSIAKLFGWTNIPVISDIMPTRDMPFGQFPTAHISEPCVKFTLDPKAELSVDPVMHGLSSVDELSVSSIVQRECLLAVSEPWTTASAVGVLLFNSRVTPRLSNNVPIDGDNTTVINLTPMGHTSWAFQCWRGDIIYRFKIVCTKFHRGRLRITWDPVSSLAATTDYTHIAYTHIVDLGETDEFEFRVPYSQSFPWLNMHAGGPVINEASSAYWGTTTYKVPATSCNGTLTVRVLTALSAPVDVAPLSIMVFVRGADNLEFANPVPLPRLCSFLEMQGGEELISSPVQERYMINWGEAIPSIRLLLRRMCKVDIKMINAINHNATDEIASMVLESSRWPPPPGYDTNAFSKATGVVDDEEDYRFTHSTTHPILWFSAPFVFSRGAIKWALNFNGTGSNSTPHTIKVYRKFKTTSANSYLINGYHRTHAVGAVVNTSLLEGQMANSSTAFETEGLPGMFITNSLTQTGVTFESPFMSPHRWQITRPDTLLLGSTYDGSDLNGYTVVVPYHPSVLSSLYQLERYASIGTDFSLHFFLNVPVLYHNTGMGQTPVTA